jgi:hypothetical protein
MSVLLCTNVRPSHFFFLRLLLLRLLLLLLLLLLLAAQWGTAAPPAPAPATAAHAALAETWGMGAVAAAVPAVPAVPAAGPAAGPAAAVVSPRGPTVASVLYRAPHPDGSIEICLSFAEGSLGFSFKRHANAQIARQAAPVLTTANSFMVDPYLFRIKAFPGGNIVHCLYTVLLVY